MDEVPAAPDVGPEAARSFSRALGIAWVGATLYEDPLSQDAFGKAAARIAGLAKDLPPLSVGDRTLRLGSRDLGDEGLSIEKLAEACSVHGIGVLRFTPELTARALATFLEIVRLPPEAVAQEGGLSKVARRRLVVGVHAYAHHQALERADELTAWDDRWSWGADSLAAVLRSVAPQDLPQTLLEGFSGAMSIPGMKERQAAVTAHIEALMTLRPSVQASTIEWIFEHFPDLADVVFGHLASHELGRVARVLGPGAHARATALLSERGGGHLTWDPVRQDDVWLEGFGEAHVPPVEKWVEELSVVARVLLASEPHRLLGAGAVDTWAHSFDALLRVGSFDAAHEWLDLPGEVDDPELRGAFERRRRELPGYDAGRVLVESSEDGDAVRVLLRLLDLAPAHLLDLIGKFDDELVGQTVTRMGSLLDGDVVSLLDDPPTSARPLEVLLRIIAATGRDVGGDRVLGYLAHASPEVVVAAIGVAGREVPSQRLSLLLRHSSPLVRKAAVRGFVGRSGDAIGALSDALLDSDVDPQTAEAAARMLVSIPGGRAILQRVASDVQLLVSARGRALRKQLQAIAKADA
jgi:hypothetical protein